MPMLSPTRAGRSSTALAMERDMGSAIVKLMVVLAGCSMLVLVLIALSGSNQNASVGMLNGKEESREPPKDKLLGGLINPSFDESSCLSRYEAALYWKVFTYKASPYLVQRLRNYEEQHKRCGPDTQPYRDAVEHLKSATNRSSSFGSQPDHHQGQLECNYVVWLPEAGLGNRITALISTFLYALITNRVMLIHMVDDFRGLFCEPFPETSWILPSDFPLIHELPKFYIQTPQSYGNLLQNNLTSSNKPYGFIYVMHDYRDVDKLFFCDGAQHVFENLPWVFLRANLYFAPGFFVIPKYDQELSRLFPEKQAVFHHLARYLLHPTNIVWGFVTRYYDAYLASARERIGIQVRELWYAPMTFEERISRVIDCTLGNGLLPEINLNEPMIRNRSSSNTTKAKAVLVVSLRSGYYDTIKNRFYEHAAAGGDVIGVHQPSHEEEQHTEERNHNVKALADIYLLSFCEKLVTSPYSTFGYLAQGIGGLRPWIVLEPKHDNPACRRAMSIDPCFLNPPIYDCASRERIDAGKQVPHVRPCEDLALGIKVFD